MIENGQPDGGYLLKYGGLEIPFQITVTDRPRLTINVYPDLKLEVFAPSTKTREIILSRIDRRAKWIVKQWRYFEQFQPSKPVRRYISGETHHYLGRQYRLKVSKEICSEVKLKGRYFRVQHSDTEDTAGISGLLRDWYLQHAQALFTARLHFWMLECRTLALSESPRLLVRSMTNRWGSCTKRGTVTLNLDLIKAPLSCIDYVIIHELCHLKIHNHSPEFYKLLTRCMPDWKQQKARLEKFLIK